MQAIAGRMLTHVTCSAVHASVFMALQQRCWGKHFDSTEERCSQEPISIGILSDVEKIRGGVLDRDKVCSRASPSTYFERFWIARPHFELVLNLLLLHLHTPCTLHRHQHHEKWRGESTDTSMWKMCGPCGGAKGMRLTGL
uniref:Uncharacterized protein n=1 Tax=Eutreptiella gymnastica TaxID=73025 RepID=A0A7S4CC83_9EUGL